MYCLDTKRVNSYLVGAEVMPVVRTLSSSERNALISLPVLIQQRLTEHCICQEVPLRPQEEDNTATFLMPVDPIGVLDNALALLKERHDYPNLCFFYDVHRSDEECQLKLCWCRFDPEDPDEAALGCGVIYEVSRPPSLLQAALKAMLEANRWKPE